MPVFHGIRLDHGECSVAHCCYCFWGAKIGESCQLQVTAYGVPVTGIAFKFEDSSFNSERKTVTGNNCLIANVYCLPIPD